HHALELIRDLPRAFLDARFESIRNDARKVARDPAARNMRQGMHKVLLQESLERFTIGLVHTQQYIRHGLRRVRKSIVHAQAQLVEQQLAQQRVAVRVKAVRRERYERVTL